jgi:Na+-translocating ferredoxin:NAD+ oxidoreductase RnfG subunit
MNARLTLLPLASLTMLGGPAYAKVYLTVEQAQAALFPGATFTPEFRTLTDEQAKAIEHASGTAVRNRQLNAWRASTGGWFIADEVVGKHDFIPLAVALDREGDVKGIEVLEYREAYGDQIRNPAWRQQFTGKGPAARLRLDKEIRNISGATLSCRHVTDGVNRILSSYAIVLAPLR